MSKLEITVIGHEKNHQAWMNLYGQRRDDRVHFLALADLGTQKIPRDHVVVVTGTESQSQHPSYSPSREQDRAHDASLQLTDLIELGRNPILGVGKGIRPLARAFGRSMHHLSNASWEMRGLTLDEPNHPFFEGVTELELPFFDTWEVRSVPCALRCLASYDTSAAVMQHVTRPVVGLHFNPEITSFGRGSVVTDTGNRLVKNVLTYLANGR